MFNSFLYVYQRVLDKMTDLRLYFNVLEIGVFPNGPSDRHGESMDWNTTHLAFKSIDPVLNKIRLGVFI